MGKISTYSFDTAVTVDDFLVGTDFEDSNITKSYLIGDIIALVPSVTWGSITGTLSNQTDLQTELNAKQDTLVSGTNIKTVGGISLLGSGDIPNSAAQYVYQIGGVNLDAQTPSVQDVILQPSLGAAASNSNVSLSLLGSIDFITGGDYLVKLFLSAGRNSTLEGATILSWRTVRVVSGVFQYGEPNIFKLDLSNNVETQEVDLFINSSAGDKLAIQIIDDSSGVNDGAGLYKVSLSWGAVPASSVKIWKNV